MKINGFIEPVDTARDPLFHRRGAIIEEVAEFAAVEPHVCDQLFLVRRRDAID